MKEKVAYPRFLSRLPQSIGIILLSTRIGPSRRQGGAWWTEL